MTIGKKLRFEIFRRDRFACRYCGKSANDGAVLEADHVVPRSRGGRDIARNLVAACEECNGGKGATPIGAPVVEDVPEDLFRVACKERGIENPLPSPSLDEVEAETYDDGRLSFAYQVLGKADQWDVSYWMHRAREAASPYEATKEEVEICAASIGLDAVFDERDRLRDIVMGFLHAIPDGEEMWKRAVAKLGPAYPVGAMRAIDIMEETLFGVLNGSAEEEA